MILKHLPPPPPIILTKELQTNSLQKTTRALLLACVLLLCTAWHTALAQSNTPLTTFPTFNGGVLAIAVSGTTIYVGGAFTQATDAPANGGATVTRNRIAAIDATTGALLSWNPNASNDVSALAVIGSNVYAGGSFTTIGGSARNRIAALDAATGTATAWDPNANSLVYALAVSGSTVYVGGAFTTIGGSGRNRIAALDAATGTATAWNPNAANFVYALAVSGSTVYAGGDFSTIGGSARNSVAALDAATGTATAWNPNGNAGVYALAVSGSNVYVGGQFSNVGGTARNQLAALDAATGTATAWNPNPDSFVYALAVSGTAVYVGGAFTTIGGSGRNRIAALDAATGTAMSWNPNADANATSLVINGSSVYAGGYFTTIGGAARQGFAAFGPPPSAAYSGTTFPEAAPNNGTITQTRTVTLTGDTWVPAGAFTGGGTHFTATGVPAGLAIAITRITPSIAEISFTGTAAAHANVNDATVTLNFTNAALAGGNAAGVTGLNPAALTLDFSDATATLSGSTFPEDGANTGTITATQDLTLAGDAWVPAGAFASPADFTATGVPAGLTVAVNRISATVARISFTGAATAHAAANNTSVTLNFTNAALAGANAGAVGSLNPTTLALTFLNPPPPPTPPAPAPVLPTAPTAFQLGAQVTLQASFNLPYGLSLIANGSPAPTYSLLAGALPPGLTLSPSGVLSGTPTQQGGYTFTVQASNDAGSTMSLVTFIVGPPRPLATFVVQPSGTIGTPVVIRGYNFTGATSVSFGGVPALSFTVDNDGQITAIVGAGNSGVIAVTTPNGSSLAPQPFTYTPPTPPVISDILAVGGTGRNAPSGDENYRVFIRGEYFSPFASFTVLPVTGTTASFAFPLDAVPEFVNSTQAQLVLPLASRTIGVKRLVMRLGNEITSVTFAVVPGAKPEILSQTVPATTASSEAFSTELVGKNFFRNGFAIITVNGNLANARVISPDRARVEIPAALNVLGSSIQVRLTNYDGQFAEATVKVQSRVPPQILSMQSRLTPSGATRFSVQGTGFWGVRRVAVQNRTVLLVNFTPTTLEIELPSGFPLPSLTEESWVLEVENLDGQKYGFRVAPQLFYPSVKQTSETNAAHSGQNVLNASNNEVLGQMIVTPNPVTETLMVSAPTFSGRGHWHMVNVRGEEVLSGVLTGGERVPVDVRSLPGGVYMVLLTGEGERVQMLSRVVVMR